MKIAIVTAYYEPVNNPRSFRATELAKGFAQKGHIVHVYSPIYSKSYKYDAIPNLKLIQLDVFSKYQDMQSESVIKKGMKYRALIKKVLYYFSMNKQLSLFFKLRKRLNIEEHYDLLISIGLPFSVHWAVSSKIKQQSIADCYIADYGDPFSRFNKKILVAPYFRKIEKKALSYFDFITCPTEKAVNSYLWLKSMKNIHVIPQGFDFSKIQLDIYKPNLMPTFAYAGLFYSDIRNPKIFFDFLDNLDLDFRFIIYTNKAVFDSYSCIAPYINSLKEKLLIYDTVPRVELIKRLSTCDFIINMNNTTSNQVPSKIIDYVLTQRPIFSFSQNSIDECLFLDFLKGDFSGQENFDISKNSIEYVLQKFIELHKLHNRDNEGITGR